MWRSRGSSGCGGFSANLDGLTLWRAACIARSRILTTPRILTLSHHAYSVPRSTPSRLRRKCNRYGHEPHDLAEQAPGVKLGRFGGERRGGYVVSIVRI